MPSVHDTRLLANLLKTEKDAVTAFKHYTLTASSAGAALSAWSVADSADTGDIMDAALRISQLLSTITDSQRSYLLALSSYRASLKDVLARETALRTVVRDREILVNRLIKVGNKKPKDNGVEEHLRKVEEAQRELRACETYLQEEELSLAAAKRHSFRDSLASRMRSMGELARIMEESSSEAVDILEGLGAGELEDFKPNHHLYEINSDGDSIAPSQSASQAMSRASSSSSLNELAARQLQAAHPSPQIPPQFRPASPSSPSRVRSLSPPARAPAHNPQPQMGAVPTAPPPISHKVYTECVPGLPTFEIPRAPDLSRRPDESDSSDEDEDDHRGAGRSTVSGIPAPQRSSHYPLDSPSVVNGGRRLENQPARLRRKALSESSSVYDGEGGGRKRRGSFLGGIAALFSRKPKERREERRYVSEEPAYGSGGGGGGDYGGARSRLGATSTLRGRDGGNRESVHDDVMRSVMNAGVRLPLNTGRTYDDDSDDETPRNTVRHVNDPSLRLKAFSDVGRSTSPPMVARAVREKRPALSRKNTGQSRASTARPMSTVGQSQFPGEEEKPRKRKVKKAASDIGMSTSYDAAPRPPAQIVVPRAPITNGLAPLASPPPLSPISAAAPSGSVTPRAYPIVSAAASNNTSGAGTPTDTGSIKKKKSKKLLKEPGQTVVLSAEALGIPTATSSASNGLPPPVALPAPTLVRSSTVKSTATTGTERTKKKKRAPSITTAEQQPQQHLPTTDELSSSLPTARGAPSAFDAHLPRPDDDPYSSSSARSSRIISPPTAAPPAVVSELSAQKPVTVKTLQEKEKKSKRMSQLHGVQGEGSWVSHPSPLGSASHNASTVPPPPAAQPQSNFVPAFIANKQQSRRSNVHEGEESLLSVVDRAEGNDNAAPSRSYATAIELAIANAGNTSYVPSSTPVPATTTPRSSSLAVNGSGDQQHQQLNKRKSVRLGSTTDLSSLPLPNSASHGGLSPSGSVRSASSSAPPPSRSILTNRDPSPVPGSAAAALGNGGGGGGGAGGGGGGGGFSWPTRGSIRAQMDADSSDEDDGSYWAARKALGRAEKGKGRAE